MQISKQDLLLTLILTLVYLVLVLELTPVFTTALPGTLVLYSFIPATLLSTGAIYVLAIYARTKFRMGSENPVHVEQEVVKVSPHKYIRPPSTPSGVTTYPQTVQPNNPGPPPPPPPQQQQQQTTKFCIHCGKPMNSQARICPSCNRGQW